tara:strand:- start:556 stop:1116 length:561 start_codon:yes stop_codon:yes gene_type:complete
MIENIFPTSIYYDYVNNREEIQNELGRCAETLNYEITDQLRMYSNDHSYQTNIIGDRKLNIFAEALDTHLQNYCSEVGFPMRPYKLDSSWFVVYKKSNHCTVHSHGHVDISGVYYIDTNGEDGNLFFVCPNPSLMSSLCFLKSPIWEHKPEVGKIMLWPGWLQHGVDENLTDHTRIALAFNIVFQR